MKYVEKGWLERADDLFAGAGGWDLAARALSIRARGVENMKEARATREAAGLTTIHDDVWTFKPDGHAAGEIASPPCPTFSAAGKGTGRKALDSVLTAIAAGAYRNLDQLREYPVSDDDDRTRLVLTPLHFATQHEYEWLAWEQVPTVLPVWEACADVLRAEGWNVWTGLLQAEMYGVPQTRKRAFLLASRHGVVAPPVPTHSRYYPRSPGKFDPGVARWVSMAEAFGWDPSGHMRSNYGTGGDPAQRGVRLLSQPAPTVTSKIDRNKWLDLPEWAFNRPSTTIVGTFKPEIVASPGYRTTVSRQNAPDSVRVTVQEAGVLQSFPADYPWQGARGRQFLQCGNAVPPGLAFHALAAAAGIKPTKETV